MVRRPISSTEANSVDAFSGWPVADPRAIDRAAVNVWGMRVSSLLDRLEPLESLLSTTERERAAKFRSESSRSAFVAVHGALHEILSAVTGRDATEIEFAHAAAGRPSIVGGQDVDFNLSHAGDAALVAVATSATVGIDVEQSTRPVDHNKMAGRFFAPSESADVVARGEPAFFHYWTKKEAVAKAIGAGVSLSLSSFTVVPEWEQIVSVPGHGTWHVVDLDPGGDYVGALAVDRQLEVRKWAWTANAVGP